MRHRLSGPLILDHLCLIVVGLRGLLRHLGFFFDQEILNHLTFGLVDRGLQQILEPPYACMGSINAATTAAILRNSLPLIIILSIKLTHFPIYTFIRIAYSR